MIANAIVIGSSSGLAQSLIPVLKRNYNVVKIGRKNSDFKLDLCSVPNNISFFENVSLVINCASDFGVSHNEDITNEVNVNAPKKLYNNCMRSGVSHFIQISSMSAAFPPSSPLYTIYSETKKKSEEALFEMQNEALTSLTILRPSQLYGYKIGQLRHRSFIREAFKQASKGEEIFIYGNHDALRNYLSFDEFSEIILRVCLKKIPGLITCTAKNNLRFSEIASKVFYVFNRKPKFLFLKNKDDLVDVISPYPHLFYERIRFHPIANIDEIFYKIAMIYK